MLTGNSSSSEEEESHFVMSYRSPNRLGSMERRGSSVGADAWDIMGIKIPIVQGEHHKYDNALLLL